MSRHSRQRGPPTDSLITSRPVWSCLMPARSRRACLWPLPLDAHARSHSRPLPLPSLPSVRTTGAERSDDGQTLSTDHRLSPAVFGPHSVTARADMRRQTVGELLMYRWEWWATLTPRRVRLARGPKGAGHEVRRGRDKSVWRVRNEYQGLLGVDK